VEGYAKVAFVLTIYPILRSETPLRPLLPSPTVQLPSTDLYVAQLVVRGLPVRQARVLSLALHPGEVFLVEQTSNEENQRRPSLPSPRGGPCTAPTQTTRGWLSTWLTTTSASRLLRRRPPRSPLRQHCRPSGRVRSRHHRTSPVRSPGCQSRLCPASGPPPASKRLLAASYPSPASPGAAPVAAATPLLREASVAVRGPPAVPAAELRNGHLQIHSPAIHRFFFC
jgi:hypothetical protein